MLCCYPDWPAMLGAALDKSTWLVALTVPVDRRRTKAVIWIGNWLPRARKCAFRAFVHRIDRMLEATRAAGYRVRSDRPGLVWRTIVVER